MIISSNKLIYLHVPKTAGNALQTQLLAISDDEKKIQPQHDGINRFEVNGPITSQKHNTLASYHKNLGGTLDGWKVMISVRHPFERAVSLFFSPNRWTQKNTSGEWYIKKPAWNEAQFLNLITPSTQCACAPITDFLRIRNDVYKPDIVLRYTHLQSDLDAALKQHGLPKFPPLPRINQSAASETLRQHVLSSTHLRDHVEGIFQDDMNLFSFETYKGNLVCHDTDVT
jgi:hypothetical protein